MIAIRTKINKKKKIKIYAVEIKIWKCAFKITLQKTVSEKIYCMLKYHWNIYKAKMIWKVHKKSW